MGAGKFVEGSRCPRCGSTLLSDGNRIWCSFVGSQGGGTGANEKPCVYGIDGPVPAPPVPPADENGSRSAFDGGPQGFTVSSDYHPVWT